MAGSLHRLVDAFAMAVEDRRPRPAIGFAAAEGAPLDCFGGLAELPAPPPRRGSWRAPSPRPCDEDRVMAVEARPARGARRGTAVLVPPWKIPSLALVAGYVRLLAKTGFDVWTVIPPRHLHRAAPDLRSGEGFVSPDLPALRAAIEQLVLELRVLLALAAQQGGETALVGLSLGALGAALAASAPERIDRVALVAPPADLAAVFERTRIGRRYLRLAATAGAPVPTGAPLAAMLAPFRPDLRRPGGARVLVAAGEHDEIAPSGAALALALAWHAEARVYARGHLTLLFACPALWRDLARFLAGAAAAAP